MRISFFTVIPVLILALSSESAFAATTYFSDAFGVSGVLSSRAPDIGTSWTKVIDNGSSIQSDGNEARVTANVTNGGSLYSANGTYASADYVAQITMTFASANDHTYSLAARIQDGDNMYLLRFNTQVMQLWKRTGGTWTQLTSTTSYPLINDIVAIQVEGALISGKINGVTVLSVEDADHGAAGTAGFGMGYTASSVDDVGTGVDADNFLVTSLDAASIAAVNPGDDETDALVGEDFSIEFSRAVRPASGNIEIRQSSDDSLFEIIDVLSERVTGSGTSRITINPDGVLDAGTAYYVNIDAGAFIDADGGVTEAIDDATTWNFTTSAVENLMFYDTFTESSNTELSFHEPDVGWSTGWVKVLDNGTSLYATDSTDTLRVIANGTDVGALYAASGSSYFTQDYEVSLLQGLLGTSHTASLAVRLQDADNMYLLRFSTNVFQLWKRSAGTWSLLDSASTYPANGQTVSLKVVGEAISGEINDVEYVSATDSDFPTGFAGVGLGETAVSTDDVGTGVNVDNFQVVGIDSPPRIAAITPADNASGIREDSNLTIEFSETIGRTGTGYVRIFRASDNSLFEAINTATGSVTGSGTDTITINPSVNLQSSTGYYVRIDANAFPDETGNFFAGINDATTWNFTTGDFTPPSISTLTPADNSTGIATNVDLVIEFDQAIGTTGTGSVQIYKASDDSLVETIHASTGAITGSGTDTITIDLASDLDDSTVYYIRVHPNAFPDASGNFFPGIDDDTTWNFTTADETAPFVSTFSPSDDAIDVSITANLVIEFNEIVGDTGTGTITIKKSSDDSVVEQIVVTGSLVTGSGTDTITVNPGTMLANATEYYVEISATAFYDVSGNNFAGISDDATWNFTTVAAISSSSSSSSASSLLERRGGSRGSTSPAEKLRMALDVSLEGAATVDFSQADAPAAHHLLRLRNRLHERIMRRIVAEPLERERLMRFLDRFDARIARWIGLEGDR